MPNAVWIISYIAIWALLIILGIVILALSREIETLHKKIDSLEKYLCQPTEAETLVMALEA